MTTKFVQVAVPRDLLPGLSLPVSRLLGRTRLALAELRLSQAKVRGSSSSSSSYSPDDDFPLVTLTPA